MRRRQTLISARTHRPLVINPRRFRFSIATHMAEEGASAFHIAEVLDHTDTQNVMVYVETVSSIADSVAKATDATLAPLVRRFQGKVVDPNEAAAFEGLPNQLIPAIAPDLDIFHLNAGGIGLCGREVRKDGPAVCFHPSVVTCALPSCSSDRPSQADARFHPKLLTSEPGYKRQTHPDAVGGRSPRDSASIGTAQPTHGKQR